MAQLINLADVSGDYLGITVTDETELVVQLSALTITKSADKSIWIEGDLTYSIVVRNVDARDPDDTVDPGQPVETVVVTDIIDPEIARYVDGTISVTLNDSPTPLPTTDYIFNYNETTGELTVTLASLAARSYITITFQVTRV